MERIICILIRSENECDLFVQAQVKLCSVTCKVLYNKAELNIFVIHHLFIMILSSSTTNATTLAVNVTTLEIHSPLEIENKLVGLELKVSKNLSESKVT